ncbi:unnamed protein product [Macrosiphum euphorbiae]|uniref:Endonuclease/exonuclease/phosphatase domain-containing protein n=1 Tax=Macrosiphum euphorbiae TaxID=13131 RepID=A0AAV0W9J8_9HEMI|nr:unnamed protein product [Macrosiphum euphorbiae]
MYKSPNTPLQTNDLDIITNHGGLFLAAGDLNAKNQSWNCRTTNQAGKTLLQHMESYNTYSICAPDSPTHHSYNPQHRPEILDIALANLPYSELTLTNHNELTSDHNPIVMTISDSPITSNPPAAKKRINWQKFKQVLLHNYPKKIINLKNPSEIDNKVLLIISSIQSAMTECSYTANQTQVSEPLPSRILQEITIKRNLRKDWQRTRNLAVKTMLNSQI